MMRMGRCLAILLALGMLCAPKSGAELNVTVSISGDLDEIIAVLEQLKRLGIGGAKAGAKREEVLQMQLRSIYEKGKTPGSILETLAPESAPKPDARLEEPQVEPGSLLAGKTARISVRAIDVGRQIDTITAAITSLGFLADLADDGTRGDLDPGDGIWSTEIVLPQDAEPGTYLIEFNAYGAYGAPLTRQNAAGETEPLRTEAALLIEAPAPLPEIPKVDGIQSQYGNREVAPASGRI